MLIADSLAEKMSWMRLAELREMVMVESASLPSLLSCFISDSSKSSPACTTLRGDLQPLIANEWYDGPTYFFQT